MLLSLAWLQYTKRSRGIVRGQNNNKFHIWVLKGFTLWNVVKALALALVPVAFIYYASGDQISFQNMMGAACLINCLQFYSFAEFWKPFKVLVKTLNHASSTLGNFLIAMSVTFVFFAFAGHVMFGNFIEGYSTITRSLTAVFDHLLNPFTFDSSMKEHNLAGVYFYYFFINIFFISECCVLSPFLLVIISLTVTTSFRSRLVLLISDHVSVPCRCPLRLV